MGLPTYDHDRRTWLRFAAGIAITGFAPMSRAQAVAMVDQPAGGFRFLPGGQVFAAGAVAVPGFEIVHAVLDPWLPLDAGYARVGAHLAALGRPMQALCGMELRLPRQFTREEFQAFNQPYVQRLVEWGLLAEGRNPVSRTNVAPAFEPPEEPMLHGFSYTVPGGGSPTFVMAGMTETGPGGQPVAAGDLSPAGFEQKLRFVIGAVGQRLAALGHGFADASHVELYTAQPAEGLLARLLMPAIDHAARRGLRWHLGRPPVLGLELELEARAVRQEVILRG